MARKKQRPKKTRDGVPIVSVNFRIPVELRARLEKWRNEELKKIVPGPVWSLSAVMIHILSDRMDKEGF